MRIIQFTDDTIAEKVKKIKEQKENTHVIKSQHTTEEREELLKLLEENKHQNTTTFDFKTNIVSELENKLTGKNKTVLDYSPSKTFGNGPGLLYTLFFVFVICVFIGYFLSERFNFRPLLIYITK